MHSNASFLVDKSFISGVGRVFEDQMGAILRLLGKIHYHNPTIIQDCLDGVDSHGGGPAPVRYLGWAKAACGQLQQWAV